MKKPTKAIGWFKTMPEPYRSIAISRIKFEFRCDGDPSWITRDANSLADALGCIEFSDLPGGEELWWDILHYASDNDGDMGSFNWPPINTSINFDSE